MYQRRLLSRYLTSGNKEFTITVMAIATVIIPCSPNHEQFISAAIASVQAQTIPAEINVYIDKHERGAGYARNAGAANVDTPFIVFVDADDTIEPTFLEKCLTAYRKGHYVYTGWIAGERRVMPQSHTPYKGEGYHLVTTLIPTQAFKEVGGFDEDLPGYEDADLHLKLTSAGLCGILVAEYLVNYSPNGTRSRAFDARPDKVSFQKLVYDRHGGEKTIMCCGQEGIPAPSNPGEKQDGDVWAMTLWGGIQTVGSVTGARTYRGGNGNAMWVAKDDVDQQPHLFKRLFSVSDLTPNREDVLKESGLI
jgi:hypothetical protein